VRLRVRGYVSAYRWGVLVPAGGALDAGLISLQRGSTIVGRVEAEGRSYRPAGCDIEVAPYTTAVLSSKEESIRLRRMAQREHPDERGFFQINGIAPGSYVVTARHAGFAPERVFPVTVLENAETELREPLRLRPGAALEVHIDPPVDPAGQAWSVQLHEYAEVPGIMDLVTQGAASVSGAFSRSGLARGRYAVQVLDSTGSTFAFEDLDLGDGQGPLSIELPLVRVRGRLFLGAAPLAGVAWFGGRTGALRIRMETGSDGRFTGVLPRDGDWLVDVTAVRPPVVRRFRKVEVRAQGGTSRQVELRVAATRLTGVVIDESGRPVQHASVAVVELETTHVVHEKTDSEGRFEVFGLAEGPARAFAETPDASSDPALVTISDRDDTELRLVLRRLKQLEGFALSQAGGVPGVTVFAMPLDPQYLLAPVTQTVSDITGHFTLGVPEKLQSLQIVAMPPGGDLVGLRLTTPAREPIRIPLTAYGGRLVLSTTPSVSSSAGDDASPLVFANDVLLDATLLRQWAAFQGGSPSEDGDLLVSRMPPGEYRTCWLGLAEYLRVFLGDQPPSHLCDSGTLSPLGELVLRRPRQEAR
jgi:hypothetical protein